MLRVLPTVVVLLACSLTLKSQQLIFPANGWSHVEEGKRVAFTLSVTDPGIAHRYSLEGGTEYGMKMDSAGNFEWVPSYDIADRLSLKKEINVIFQADLKDGKRLRQHINFIVKHVNRPPVVEELPTFYVRQGVQNQYQVPAVYVHDLDGDPVTLKPHTSEMPEGATLSSLGLFTWTPSRHQFNLLKNNPLNIEFVVQDPDKAETVGRIRVAQTQLDLPPELLLVPGDTIISIGENEVVYFKVYIADPNGDDNIDQVGFISSDSRIYQNHLKENTIVQREFNWTPGYDFVEEAEKKREVTLVFFAFDKSSNRVQRKVKITVNDTENVEEKDRILYQKYYNSLAATCNLILTLDKNLEKLEVTYKRARKGKKNRTILNASLGAMTGLSPLVLETDPSKVVSVVGGTSVLTLNSLEAGQVIGKNSNEYQNKIKTNRDLRTQLQLKGNYFARKYSLKSSRRSADFEPDRDEIARLINSESLATLEIRADAPPPPPTSKDIKKAFPDFSEEGTGSSK